MQNIVNAALIIATSSSAAGIIYIGIQLKAQLRKMDRISKLLEAQQNMLELLAKSNGLQLEKLNIAINANMLVLKNLKAMAQILTK